MQNNEPFWLVWNPNGNAPTYRHPSIESATREAERLARGNTGQTFIVLESVAALVKFSDSELERLRTLMEPKNAAVATFGMARIAAQQNIDDADAALNWLAAAPKAAPAAGGPVKLPFAIMDDELEALRRFDECARDFEAGGHDVRKEMMKRLAEIGLVRRVTANIYEHTTFGLSVLGGDFDAAPAPKAAPELPPMGHPLQKLGARLSELLDEDQWAECERLLLEGWAHDVIDRKTGQRWRENSDLGVWFPLTAEELERLRTENAELRHNT